MSASRGQALRVIVIGAGYVARHHLAALKALPFVEIVGLVDVNLSAARPLAAEFGVKTVASTLAEIAGQSPDVAYVLTPPESHCALTLQALEYGCHVLVEKPMAETIEECVAMTTAASQRGRVLSVNHSDRFDPVVVRALNLVKSGACGDPIILDILRSSEYPPYAGGPLPAMVRQGSFPFRDLGTHGLYLIESFLGPISALDVVRRESGRNPNLRFDEWYALVTCERGIGRLQISWNVRPMQSRLILQGTRGIIEVDRFLQLCRFSRAWPGPKFVGTVLAGFMNAVKEAFQIPFNVIRFAASLLKPSPGIRIGSTEFARAIYEGKPPPVSAAEGSRIVALMEPACSEADRERTAELAMRLLPMPPVPILVTGAAGFLGSALVRRLRANGSEVRVLVRRSLPWMQRDTGIQWVVGDLGDPEVVSHAVKGVDVVYHVGAAMRGDASEYSAGTVWGTRNVVASCIKWQVKRLVYVSSLSVLDHAGRNLDTPVSETSELEPRPELRGFYTQSKLDAEQIVVQAIQNERLPAVIIRPGQIFGPGAENVTPNGVVAIAGRWIAVGPGDQTIPLVYVEDVVDALMLAATKPDVVARCFHVVDPRQSRQDEYLAAVCRHRGRDVRVHRVPRAAFLGLAVAVELLGKILHRTVPLTRYRVRSLRPLANFQLDAVRQDLGWEPRIGVEGGLARTFPAK